MKNEDYGGRSCPDFSGMIIIRAYSQQFLYGFLIKIQVYLDFKNFAFMHLVSYCDTFHIPLGGFENDYFNW